LSLIATGRPCSGPSASPAATARSAARASARARAKFAVTMALTAGLTCSIRAMQLSSSATGESRRVPISRRASIAGRSQGSAGVLASRTVVSLIGRHPPNDRRGTAHDAALQISISLDRVTRLRCNLRRQR